MKQEVNAKGCSASWGGFYNIDWPVRVGRDGVHINRIKGGFGALSPTVQTHS